jgi:hypothetical protein
MAMSTRFPREARAMAIAAETVVLPTPPLPVTKRKRREPSSPIGVVTRRAPIAPSSPGSTASRKASPRRVGLVEVVGIERDLGREP